MKKINAALFGLNFNFLPFTKVNFALYNFLKWSSNSLVKFIEYYNYLIYFKILIIFYKLLSNFFDENYEYFYFAQNKNKKIIYILKIIKIKFLSKIFSRIFINKIE